MQQGEVLLSKQGAISREAGPQEIARAAVFVTAQESPCAGPHESPYAASGILPLVSPGSSSALSSP